MSLHKCIKPTCSNTYEDEEIDDYYCTTCIEEKNKIAKEVDMKIASRPKRKVISELQEYDNAPKVRGFMRVSLN